MSGVLCFTSQDGPFADGMETEVSFNAHENATFVYTNEEELDQMASRTDPSVVQETQNTPPRTTTTTTLNNIHKDNVPIISGCVPPILDIGPFWMFLGKLFDSTILSVILLGVTISLSLALGGISVFVVKPSPYFDKSLDAFQIPNHESTMRLEAFDLAKKDSFSSIKKRSVGNDDADLQYSRNGDRAITDDAIDMDSARSRKMQHVSDSLLEKQNKQLFMNYKKHLNMQPINDIHHMDEDTSKASKAELLSRQRRSMRRYRTTSWKLQLVYIAQGKGDRNIFTPERLETIHNVEMSIMQHEEFGRFCSRNYHSFSDPALEKYNYCLPPNSLMTYFYPSKVLGNQIKYDGVGSELSNVNGTLAWAMQQESFYWYVDTHMNSTNRKSAFIRSEIYFGRPIGEDSSLPASEQFRQYKTFITSYIKLLKKASTSEVRVLYGGTEIFDYEVSDTIHHDLMLAIPCIISITILLFVLTSFSLWLTVCGCLSIFLSFALAYFVFHVLCGIDALGLLNLVSAFVIIGIGVDDVFVFINTFRQAEHIFDSRVRMAYTVKTAGTATFFTSVTTAGAFAANMASQIPAIYSFGLFMMLIVSFCWVTVFLIMPPALNLWRGWIHCEVHCFPSGAQQETIPIASPGLQRILSAHEQETQQQLQQQRVTADGQQGTILDDDIPMLDIEDDDLDNSQAQEQTNQQQHQQQNAPSTSTAAAASASAAARQLGIPLDDTDDDIILDIVEKPIKQAGLLVDDDDVPIIDLDGVTVSTVVGDNGSKRNLGGLTKILQTFLKKFVADPVIKARWIIIGIYLLLVGITVMLVFQIQPSSRPPALYREDTNLQQLLDLAYNFSGADISCKSCSGFTQSDHAPAPHQPVTLPPVHLLTTATTTRKATTTKRSRHTTKPSVVTTVTPESEGNVVTQWPVTTKSAYAMTTQTKKTCAQVDLDCKFGAQCMDDPHQGPICQCITGCPIIIEPLCDTDGNTQVNECALKVVSCQLQKPIGIAYEGQCKDKSDDPNQPSGGATHGPDPVPGGGVPGHSGGSTSAGSDYNPCKGGNCGNAAVRPILDNTAVVYVVFGIEGVDKSNVSNEHVLNEDKGNVIYDDKFNIDDINKDINTIKALCKICKALAARTDLVIKGGAECFPQSMDLKVKILEATVPECAGLPRPNLMKGQRSKAIGKEHKGSVVWFAMAFESITYMGISSFEAYKDYLLWEHALESIKSDLTPEERTGVDSAFQTCEFWKQVFMEIVGVTSAIYGLAFSLFVCIIAVVIFTAHVGILLIAFFTISGVILVVISMFYLLGWQMGAVEAVSLSILVGSSVDYCIHLIEGYLVAGDEIPNAETKSNGALRRWRTRQSLTTIGVSILSSAVTTLIAAIPLSCTTIQLFAKFGKIVAINTFVSILFTLTACTSFLSCFAPAKYRWNFKWLIISSLIVGGFFGALILALYFLHSAGYTIPGPSGNSLFS